MAFLLEQWEVCQNLIKYSGFCCSKHPYNLNVKWLMYKIYTSTRDWRMFRKKQTHIIRQAQCMQLSFIKAICYKFFSSLDHELHIQVIQFKSLISARYCSCRCRRLIMMQCNRQQTDIQIKVLRTCCVVVGTYIVLDIYHYLVV